MGNTALLLFYGCIKFDRVINVNRNSKIPPISVLVSWPSEMVFFLLSAWVFAKLKCPKSTKTYQIKTAGYISGDVMAFL